MKENNLKEAKANIDTLPSDVNVNSESKRDSKPLSALNRQLTEDDLNSVGVRKLLLGQMDEFENCKIELAEIKSIYHERDKEVSVLRSKLNDFVCFDWIYSALLTVGSILIGYYASKPESGFILLFIGVICIIFAISLKLKYNNENKNK